MKKPISHFPLPREPRPRPHLVCQERSQTDERPRELALPIRDLTRPPWLGDNDQPLSVGRLKQRSKTWGLELWQSYLEYLMSEESFLSEARISPKAFEEELDGMIYEIDECLEGPRDFSNLHAAIETLNFLQREVIQKMFWSGQTVREIAHEMGLPRSTVQDLKTAALTKLYAKIPDTHPLIRGEVEFLPQKDGRKRVA